jgi:hypothetical protein
MMMSASCLGNSQNPWETEILTRSMIVLQRNRELFARSRLLSFLPPMQDVSHRMSSRIEANLN